MTLEKINEQIESIQKKLQDPKIGSGTVVTSARISGYMRPVENWNQGKQQEFIERAEYTIN